MVIKSQHVVGIAGAFALVGAALWASVVMFAPPTEAGSVEIVQVPERSWAVEITDLGAADANAPKRTAANR
jgi:hypothetical protein